MKELKFKDWDLTSTPSFDKIAIDDDPLEVLTNYNYHILLGKVMEYILKDDRYKNMRNAYIYYFMAKEFGFKPKDVDEMDSLTVLALILTHINVNKR
jgi:hypothetical protein